MKVNLNSETVTEQVPTLRSQITGSSNLQKFDNFMAENDEFDFNNDDHLMALKKDDCHCHVETTVPINL